MCLFLGHLFGDVPFQFGWDQWDYVFFNLYSRPAAKIFGSAGSYTKGKQLGCAGGDNAHNACLPSCNSDGNCE